MCLPHTASLAGAGWLVIVGLQRHADCLPRNAGCGFSQCRSWELRSVWGSEPPDIPGPQGPAHPADNASKFHITLVWRDVG